MSYDLFFCNRPDTKVSKEDISSYISNIRNISDDWVYHNEDTGVYFILELSSQSENDVESIVPSEYYDVGLAVNINYNRPKFFADEAMPVIASLCKDLDLLVIDPQDHEIGGDSSPKLAAAEELVDSWTKSNRVALSIYKQQGTLPSYLPRDKAEAWWKYQYHRQILQNDFGESIFVPNIFLFEKPDDQKVITSITWTDSIPITFPICDKVLIIHMEIKGLLRKRTEPVVKGIISSDIIRDKFQKYITDMDTVIGPMQVVNPEQDVSIKDLFFQLSDQLDELDYERIGPDYMIDEIV